MLLFIYQKNEVNIQKECVKMHLKNVFLNDFFTVHQTEKIQVPMSGHRNEYLIIQLAKLIYFTTF